MSPSRRGVCCPVADSPGNPCDPIRIGHMRGSGLSQPAQQHRQISVITCRLVSMDVPKGACSMVRQAQYNEIPPHVDYTLTEAFRRCIPSMMRWRYGAAATWVHGSLDSLSAT